MTLERRINAFHQLGQKIKGLSPEEKEILFAKVANENPWFTEKNLDQALKGIALFLNTEVLKPWVNSYSLPKQSKKVGIAMAGNIPLVGFHDLLCVLISGHKAVAKLSSSDSVLMKYVRESLIAIEPELEEVILFEERLNHVDAVIATGSDNTSRYFEYYFRNIPHVIRKNRSSCAVILGEETPEEFTKLGDDIFTYFGLGCRNVSTIYVPEKFDFTYLLKNLESFQPIINHHKYANNYDYQKSILLLNQTHFFDTGFLLLTENENLVSPISTIYYQYYKDQEDLHQKLQLKSEKIQCIVSARGWYKPSIPFGEAQSPTLTDYADGIDTMAFLQNV